MQSINSIYIYINSFIREEMDSTVQNSMTLVTFVNSVFKFVSVVFHYDAFFILFYVIL